MTAATHSTIATRLTVVEQANRAHATMMGRTVVVVAEVTSSAGGS